MQGSRERFAWRGFAAGLPACLSATTKIGKIIQDLPAIELRSTESRTDVDNRIAALKKRDSCEIKLTQMKLFANLLKRNAVPRDVESKEIPWQNMREISPKTVFFGKNRILANQNVKLWHLFCVYACIDCHQFSWQWT